MRLYTLGYQSLSLADYLNVLVTGRVGLLIDVRDHAWSQRPEFVKGTLRTALEGVGIQYIHLRDVGNPASIRKTSRSATECLRRYRAHIKSQRQALINLLECVLKASAIDRPACLTCYERSAHECHRLVLVEELVELESRIDVVHLPLPKRENPSKSDKRRPAVNIVLAS